MSRLETQIFYICIMILSTFFAFKSQIYETDKNGEKCIKFKVGCLIVSFLIPWFVMAFTNIGSDYNNYYDIIDKLTWQNFDKFFAEEAGMNLVFLILKIITNNVHVTIFLIKTVSISLIFMSLYLIKDHIKIGYAVLSYLLLIYLPSFYLLTIALSQAITFFAVVLRVYKGKKFLPIILIVLAAQFHNSAYMFLFMYLSCELIMKSNQSKLRKVFITIGCVIIGISAGYIYNYFLTSVSGFHYTHYKVDSYSGTGLMFWVYYIPLLYIYYLSNIYNKNKTINNLIYIYILFSALIHTMGYKFIVIGRMEYYILPLYSIFLPDVMQKMSLEKKDGDGKTTITILEFYFLIYILFRGYLVFIERTTHEYAVGLYRFFNPFS